MINTSIRKLINYGLECGLIEKDDEIYTVNRILEILNLDEYNEPEGECEYGDLEEILTALRNEHQAEQLAAMGETA